MDSEKVISQDRPGIAIASSDGPRIEIGKITSKSESGALPKMSHDVAKNLTLQVRYATNSEPVRKAKQ